MNIRLTDRPAFQLCGYSVETSLDESKKDVAELYSGFFSGGKATQLADATKNKGAEYYGLMWYTQGHERYRYLLGKETVNHSRLPAETEVKEIPAALYAVASFEKDYESVKAWTDFFFEAIPQAGYAPDYEHGFFFEYYPHGVNGAYQLWTPVVKAKT